jgi:energy-converting hydrogenase Eha subunit C
MRVLSNVLLSIGGFLAIAAGVYWFTAHEPIGATLFLIGSITFFALGLVVRASARHADRADTQEVAEAHVSPTIWPLGFAVSGVLLALGLIVSAWLLVAGGLVFVLSAAGWLRDVARAQSHVHEP